MASTLTLFDAFKLYITDGTLDLNSNTFKCTLHTSAYTPNASSQTQMSHINAEVANANGYTTGGKTLTTIGLVNTAGTVKWSADNLVWSATGGSIVARYAVISATNTANGVTAPLVGYITLNDNGGSPLDVTVTDGNTLTLQWNVSGIITLS
jgi:hypothetical protein